MRCRSPISTSDAGGLPARPKGSVIGLRRACESDRGALEALLRQSWLDNWGPHVRPASIRRFHAENPVRRYVDACLGCFEVAVADGEVVAMMHVEGGFLHALHVAAAMQGQGVGSILMARAQALGARRLEVRAFNARARRFYRARGWQEAGRSMDAEMGTPLETVEMVLAAGP